jgi:hypothetical protein
MNGGCRAPGWRSSAGAATAGVLIFPFPFPSALSTSGRKFRVSMSHNRFIPLFYLFDEF